jgi:hypothetical protein
VNEDVFTNKTWTLPVRLKPDVDDTPLRIESNVEGPADPDPGNRVKPYVTWWDDSPEGGGFCVFSARRAREIAAALTAAAEKVEAAIAEAANRGIEVFD